MPLHVRLYVAIFALSGCAGLIYESIWTHYLKLLLGHAAYAQTLVLSLFMGGLAAGAWLAARLGRHWTDLLRAYLLLEAVLALFAFGFHPLFAGLSQWLQFTVLPGLPPGPGVQIVKWSAGAAMILPQTLLLGMTFPLLSAGLLRLWPVRPGRTLASLYFANSAGGALGVLASGFWLIEAVGLPGTILAAGLLNVAVAAMVLALRHGHPAPPAPPARQGARSPRRADGPVLALLGVAMVTGLASFIYEIVWIRMLSMVLGAATHAFELMLSAFIAGLAIGGWWIARRIDTLTDASAWLGRVQVLMGILALGSLAIYGQCFELMSWLMQALARNDSGYTLYLLASHGIALLVMLPATICAGMTLPLITLVLLRRGAGETAIGGVYAANTVGAIAGVLFTVQFGMPLLGLRNSLLTGAALDIAVGIALLAAARAGGPAWRTWAGAGAAAMLATAALVELDPYRMASGVFRYGRAALGEGSEVLFHHDGKTATVNLIRMPGQVLSITTNGKPDAAVIMADGEGWGTDEPTMTLAGALPLALRPQARTAAVIGMGSGLTSATLLAGAGLARVDTIEIEAGMVAAARGFRPRTERVWTDPRSRIHIEDARTFFGLRGERYDIIVSEPSNPWVSGVAGLFSREFYRTARQYLAADGVLIQWLQLYEINLPLVASVMKALGEEFPAYTAWFVDNGDMLIVASSADTDRLHPGLFADPAMREALAMVGVHHADDLAARRLAGRALLEPALAAYPVPANSDYHPWLDQRAVRARYLRQNAGALPTLAWAPLPIVAMLDGLATSPSRPLTVVPENPAAELRADARALLGWLADPRTPTNGPPTDLAADAHRLMANVPACDPLLAEAWTAALFRLAAATLAWLDPDQATTLLDRFDGHPCAAADAAPRQWLALARAVGARDAGQMLAGARALLPATGEALDADRLGYLLGAGMLGALADGQPSAALELWRQYARQRWNEHNANIHLRVLLFLARARVAAETTP